jgi:hypothetical protein
VLSQPQRLCVELCRFAGLSGELRIAFNGIRFFYRHACPRDWITLKFTANISIHNLRHTCRTHRTQKKPEHNTRAS